METTVNVLEEPSTFSPDLPTTPPHEPKYRNSFGDGDADSTIHGFNISHSINVTIIDNSAQIESSPTEKETAMETESMIENENTIEKETTIEKEIVLEKVIMLEKENRMEKENTMKKVIKMEEETAVEKETTMEEETKIPTKEETSSKNQAKIPTSAEVKIPAEMNTPVEMHTPVEIEITSASGKNNSCEGSDSGVEVLENPEPCKLQRTLSTNSANFQDFDAVTPAQSCDSSIISCCSNYEMAYNSLVRRNSTLLEEYKLRNSDGTSEGGSESSSVISPRHGRRTTNSAKKKVSLADKSKTTSSTRSRSKPPITPKNSTNPTRGKSGDRSQKYGDRSQYGERSLHGDRLQHGERSQHRDHSHKSLDRSQKSLDRSQKSIDRTQKPCTTKLEPPKSLSNKKPTPNTLTLGVSKKEKKTNLARSASVSKTPTSTPTDDGRWPSVHSKPAPLMTRSFRNILPSEAHAKIRVSQLADMKTLDKYGTLPRRRKERSADNLSVDNLRFDLSKSDNLRPDHLKSENLRADNLRLDGLRTDSLRSDLRLDNLRADNIKDLQTKRPLSRENSVNKASIFKRQSSRETTPSKTLPPYPRKKLAAKVKIYHETSIQTALTLSDIDKMFSGAVVSLNRPQDVEKCDQELQVDSRFEDLHELEEKHKKLAELYELLSVEFEEQKVRLTSTEQKLQDETAEKNSLKEELKQNTDRVLAILGGDESFVNEGEEASNDSLMVLENRFQNVSQVIIKQENEISKLNDCCRSLQRDLDKSMVSQKFLLVQQHELEAESVELQEFMQAEKTTLSDALKDSESEIKRLKLSIVQKDKDLESKQEEYKHLFRLGEQRRQDNMSLQDRLSTLEGKCRELLLHQGGSMSGAAVALSALILRLDRLVEELVASYEISDQELDDVIFHNEAYSNSSSSSDATPDNSKAGDKTPSPTRGSFISAIINAIKSAAAQSPFAGHRDTSRDNLCADNSDPTEMLDSETEPCLMMEHVLEDVVIPDCHSHNMISSGHSMLNSRLTHSESLNNISQAILNRQMSEQTSFSLTESLNASYTSDMSSLSELCPSISVVDQVIDVDNLITRLLKVIRIIQIESDDSMVQLQTKYEELCEDAVKEKRANKGMVKQLEEWEKLGSTLKQDVKKLLQQLSKKNIEIEDIKGELNQQRKEVEKLNQDVCDLSTALSKSELELRMKEEEVAESLKRWEETNEIPEKEVLARLVSAQNEIPVLMERLVQKDKQLREFSQEYQASKQVISENWKEAVTEAKKQYDAIDNALETLHSIQSVVQQCPPLAKMQRDLEETNFQSASASTLVVPPDCNANAALLQAMANLEIASPINSTA